MKQYVLVTAAYNEESRIGNLIQSVAAQTYRPAKWVIVSDGSTDRTDEIVADYALRTGFIHLLRTMGNHRHSWVNQVHAINLGFQELWPLTFDFIGNLDADITVEPAYFAELMTRFGEDPTLGVAGGYIYEPNKGQFHVRKSNNALSVPHAVQLFRRACFEQLGRQYLPLPYGGSDSHAEISARLHGWKTRSFTDLKVYHHRLTGSANGLLRMQYQDGLQDYSLGTHWCFELFRIGRRLGQKPCVLGAMARLCAFTTAFLRHARRPVSAEFIRFLQKEELSRLGALVARSSRYE